MRYPDGKKTRLYEAVGRRLAAARIESGSTMPFLAKTTGVSLGQLAKIEGGYPCPLHVLVALADVYDMTLDELVPILTEARVA